MTRIQSPSVSPPYDSFPSLRITQHTRSTTIQILLDGWQKGAKLRFFQGLCDVRRLDRRLLLSFCNFVCSTGNQRDKGDTWPLCSG